MKICQTSTNGGTDGHSHGQIRPWRTFTSPSFGQIFVPNLENLKNVDGNENPSSILGVLFMEKTRNVGYLPCRP